MATYNKETFKRLFQSKFNLSKWQMLLQDYFHADKVRVSPEVLDEDAEDRKGYFLGSMTTQDNYELGFFYYEMEDGSVLRRKVGLRNLIRPYLGYGFDAALAVFNDGTNWRLSLICDLKEDATSTKRFTYVFGDEKAYYKTPVSRFVSLQKKANEFLEIKKAFSVEALSDDFFAAYRKQYAEFVKFLTGKEYVKKGNKWVEQETGEPDAQYFTSFKEDDKLVRDYIKKMMGRIVFLYFLQSKGWLAGNLHYMHDLFYDASDEVKEDFLDKVLEPMFFGLLNTKPEDRSSAPLVNGVGVKYIPNADKIPYLNGGLFQQEKIDEVDSVFPAGMFQSLFDFFDSYNFTIDENDPNDAEVGVDPEMLGKIFENLLEDNKDKGAFYTPKEIVRYMCQESLTAYLQTGIDDAEIKEHIANFVKTNDVEELGGASSELAMSIDRKLIDVKICDPAIGSGAFPMGLLRELYACRKSIEIFEEDNAADIKRHIIQNNIYGVDIEKGAVDIARLRFWLALIIDEKEPMPLPNLDFKIMQGNSLLESYKGVDLDVTSKKLKTGKDTKKTRGVLSLGFEETDVQKTIQDLVKSYFSITDHTLRAQRRQQIDKYVKDYIKVCAEGNHEVQDAVDELEIPNDQFFLWHTYFADVFEQGGFDIVIGNPPYIRVQNLSHEIIDIYKKTFTTAWKRIDISTLFIEHLSKFLSSDGILCYITSNQFLVAEYGRKMRDFLISNSLLARNVDFGDLPIFENALTYVSIFFMSKLKKEQFEYIKIPNLPFEAPKSFETCAYEDYGAEPWAFVFSAEKQVMKKIQKFEPLKKRAYAKGGIITGNDAFYLFKKNEFPVEDELSLNLIRTDDIARYYLGVPSMKVFYPCELDAKGDTSVMDINSIASNFPEGYSYIMDNEDVMKSRKDSRNTMGDKKNWYQPVRFGTLSLFKGKKIIGPGIVKHNKFVLDDKGYAYSFGNMYSIVARDESLNLSVLLGILNSRLIEYYLHSTAPIKQGGYFAYGATVLEKIPLSYPIGNCATCIKELVSEVIDIKKNDNIADTSALENRIDFLVYHLYGLTYDEVLIVDPETPISREEYEAYNIEQ